MSDYDLPDLPSDEDLGITEEDLEDLPDDGPELSETEMRELLGEEPPKKQAPPPPPPSGKGPPSGQEPPPGEPPPQAKKPAPPKEAPGPKARWRGPATLVALLILAWMSSSYRTIPSPVAANAPDTVFSSARAMAHLVEIARAAHPPGSPEHARVREYIVERLGTLGVTAEIQTTTSMVGRGSVVRAVTARNIVARIPGTASTGAVLLTAHYDGREIALAAGDDGSGVVTILETVRALGGESLRNDIIVLITDAEELGLLGARAFVDEHDWMADVTVALSFEMRGSGGPSVMFETGSDNGWIMRALAEADSRPYANSLSYEVYKSLPNDTDFTPFKEAGTQGLNFAAIGHASVYHQEYDSPANLSEATLQHHGEQALSLTRHLGNADLALVDAPDVTFFSVPWFGLIVYGMGLVLPLAGALLVLAALSFVLIRRAGGRTAGLLVGLGLGVVAVALSGAAGFGLMKWLPGFHPEFGSLHGSAFHAERWYVMALASVAFSVVTLLFGVARRWFSASELAWGAIVIPLLGAIYLSATLPAAAMNLQWPAAAALLGTILLITPRAGTLKEMVWIGSTALALPVFALLVPSTEFLWLGLSMSAAVPLGVVIAVLYLLVLPALEGLREPNGWWAPLTGVVVAGTLLGLGINAASPTAERPAPSTLLYAYDHGTNEALWVTDGSEDPADAEAVAWAESRAGGAFDEEQDLAAFGYRGGPTPVREAPLASVAPPEATVLRDSLSGDQRHLRLAVRSALNAELVQFRFPEGGATRLTALNGRSLPIDDQPTLVEHWGAPDSAIVLDLELPANAAVQMDIVEHLLRPEELLGEDPFRRPAHLAPDIVRQSDRAMVRAPFTILDLRSAGTAGSQAALPGASLAGTATAPDSSTVADTIATPDTVATDTIPAGVLR